MSIQSSSMPLLAIPDRVLELGPQLSRLPNELLFIIFKILATIMWRSGVVIDPTRLLIMFCRPSFKQIRAVSPSFHSLFMQAILESFKIRFKPKINSVPKRSAYLTMIPPRLPPQNLWHHLRSMHIQLVLENYYWTPGRIMEVVQITTAAELKRFCPSARLLLRLTHPVDGFGSLAFLHLHLQTAFLQGELTDAFLQALDVARITVTAGRVELVVTDDQGDVGRREEEVKSRIIVG